MDKLRLEGIYRQGFGIIPKSVMHDPELTLESKAIYAYLCALAGSGDQTFPYRDTILRHTGLSKNTYYRHYKLLLDAGYITVTRPSDKTAANIYTLVQNPKKLPDRPSQGEDSRLRYRGLKAHGYGSIPRAVMMDEGLGIKAKGLYAYFCSYCGGGDCAFPKKDDILFHLGISEPTYYKALTQLKETGYIETRQRKDNGRFAVNDYYLNDGLSPCTCLGQVASFQKTQASPNTTEKLAKKIKNTQSHSAPFQETSDSDSQTTGARTVCSFKLPDPRIWDIKNGDTIFRDTKNCDGIYNNKNSSNNLSNISPSIGEGGWTDLEEMVVRLLAELREKAPRKNQALAIAARNSLLNQSSNGELSTVLLEKFMAHLTAGLQGKQIRNLQAYCRKSLYNWIVEQPIRENIKMPKSVSSMLASYDLGALDQFVDAGDFGGRI